MTDPPPDIPPTASLPCQAPSSPRIRVATVEDDTDQLDFVVRHLARFSSFECAGFFRSAEAALQALPLLLPDVVLVDIGLPGMSGTDLVRQVKPRMPRAQFMMLTVIDDAPRIFEALEAGATGYLLKMDIQRRLREAIQDLHQGGSPMSSTIARQVVQSLQKQRPTVKPPDSPQANEHLTDREQQILNRLAAGKLYKEIAAELGIALGTVNTHVRRIYEKLHVHSRHQAMTQISGYGGT
ncbi:MAG: response regulator transcription factor [Verrucomicrobiales bacterium]|nr:response regulator transcription factor [Verrucomicrobiales bacterium]